MPSRAVVVVAWLAITSAAGGAPAAAATLHGRITDRSGLPLPGVVVSAVNAVTTATQSTVTDDDGQYRFDVPDGRYDLAAHLAAFRPGERHDVAAIGDGVAIDLVLDLEAFAETVVVDGQSARPLLTEPAPNAPALVTRAVIDNAMLPNSRYDDALTLMPGVVRTADGSISIAAARPEESGLFVDGINLTDPVTGLADRTLPIEAVESVDVHAGGYAADLGPATGGVTAVQTRSGANQFRGSYDSLFPRLIFSDDVSGVEYWEPNVGVSGALVKDRIFFTQGIGYRFDRNFFETLSGPGRNRVSAPSSWTQIDAALSPAHRLQASLSVDRQNTDHAGITAFFPVAVAPELDREAWSAALVDRLTTHRGSTLEWRTSVVQSAIAVGMDGNRPEVIGHETAAGDYFARNQRQAARAGVGVSYLWMPAPAHALKVGGDIGRLALREDSANTAAVLLRGDGSISRTVQFAAPASATASTTESDAFISDVWTARHWLTLEAGLRYDGNSAAAGPVIGPRVAWTIGQPDAVTSVSGSLGLFADKLVPGALTYAARPASAITLYDQTGPATRYAAVPSVMPFEEPRALRWDLGLDRRIGTEWTAHVRYQERHGDDELIVDPVTVAASTSRLVLSSRGLSVSRALEMTGGVRPRDGRADFFLSYVRSATRGNLNTFQAISDVFSDPFVQPDQRGPQPADVPHHVLAWGVLTLPRQVSLAPFLDARSGFPYSVIDDDWIYVDGRNRGRLPWTASVDLSVTKVVVLPRGLPRARLGIKLYRLVSVDSERDVQRNIDSPVFGTRYNPVPRDFAFVCTFLGGHH